MSESVDLRLSAARGAGWAGVAARWTLFLTVLAGLMAFAHWVERERLREVAGFYETRAKRVDLRMLMTGLRGTTTYDQLVARFTPDAPPATKPSIGRSTFRATFDGSSLGAAFAGWTVHATFTDGNPDGIYGQRGRGHLVSLHAIPPREYDPNPSPLWQDVQSVRRAVVVLAAIAWLATSVLLTMAGPWRRRVAQVCLAAALAGTAAWMARPPLTQWAAYQTTGQVAAAVMIVVAFIGLAVPSRRRKVDESKCGHCGYDLTGNVSGACPECGTFTPTMLATLRHQTAAEYARWLELQVPENRPAHAAAAEADDADAPEPDLHVGDAPAARLSAHATS